MTRIIGEDNVYRFELKTATRGWSSRYAIELPSISSVIRRTLAHTALDGWAYQQTLSGVVELVNTSSLSQGEMVGILGDERALDEWLTSAGVRPQDTTQERSGEGDSAHTFLNQLAIVQLVRGKDAATSIAKNHASGNEDTPGYQVAIGRWWKDRKPEVITSEEVVYALSPHGGMAGTLDLVYKTESGDILITDLKTRKAGSTAYRTDKLQVAGYRVAWNSCHPRERISRGSVLVAKADGTYVEKGVPPEYDEAFLALLQLDQLTREDF